MKIIEEKKYCYVLMEDGGGWFLTFMSGGPVEVDFCIQLSEQEIQSIKQDIENVENLIKDVQRDPVLLQRRRITPSIWP